MTPKELLKSAIEPAIAILGDKFGSKEALVMLLAIAGQESKIQARRQLVKKNGKLVPEGPATSFWQFEENGGVRGVLVHPANEVQERRLCATRGVPYEKHAVWQAMEHDDVLGAGMARMLLAADIGRLPALGNEEAAWAYYLKVWRPGKPHKATWHEWYTKAMKEIVG